MDTIFRAITITEMSLKETLLYYVFVCLFVMFPFYFLYLLLLRKSSADLQARVGPNRVGYAGVFQEVADFLKLFQKQNSKTTNLVKADLFAIFSIVFSSFYFMPLTSYSGMGESQLASTLCFVVFIFFNFGLFVLSKDLGSEFDLYSSLRFYIQSLSGLFCGYLIILSLGIKKGSLSWSTLVEKQGMSPLGWNLFSDPIMFFAFFIFVCAGAVALSRAPFSSYKAQELGGGIKSKFVGYERALMAFLFRYLEFFYATMAAATFLGGWNFVNVHDHYWNAVLQAVVVCFKALVVLIFMNLVSKAIPRMRADITLNLTWRVLAPLSFLVLMLTLVFSYGRQL